MPVIAVDFVTRTATRGGGATAKLLDLQKTALRQAGMIATSPSLWHRWWQAWRLMMYPWFLWRT